MTGRSTYRKNAPHAAVSCLKPCRYNQSSKSQTSSHAFHSEQHSDRNTVENDARGRLAKEGKLLKAGQTLRFIVASHKKQARKAIPLELVNERTAYDPDRYVELLAQVCNSVTEPFRYVIRANDY